MAKKPKIVRENGGVYEIKRVKGGIYPEGTVFFMDVKVPISLSSGSPTSKELELPEPTLADLKAGERNILFEGKTPELPPEAPLSIGRERPAWLRWIRGNYTADVDAPED